MENIKQKFYESAYPKEDKKHKLRSSIGWLYLLLRRYENYREDIVYDLLPSGNKFLDIGCGEGDLVFKTLTKFKFVTGVDIARTRVTKANKRKEKLEKETRGRVKFLVADADNKLPFSAELFDAVSMVATLEHFFDPFHVMEEVKRVLKKSGLIVIQVPNLCFLPRRLAVLFGKLPVTSEDETGWDGGHLHYFTVDSLTQLLKKYYLRPQNISCSGVFAALRKWWLSMLGADIIIVAKKASV